MMEKCPHCGSDKDDDWYHGTDCCRDCYHEFNWRRQNEQG